MTLALVLPTPTIHSTPDQLLHTHSPALLITGMGLKGIPGPVTFLFSPSSLSPGAVYRDVSHYPLAEDQVRLELLPGQQWIASPEGSGSSIGIVAVNSGAGFVRASSSSRTTVVEGGGGGGMGLIVVATVKKKMEEEEDLDITKHDNHHTTSATTSATTSTTTNPISNPISNPIHPIINPKDKIVLPRNNNNNNIEGSSGNGKVGGRLRYLPPPPAPVVIPPVTSTEEEEVVVVPSLHHQIMYVVSYTLLGIVLFVLIAFLAIYYICFPRHFQVYLKCILRVIKSRLQ